MLKQAVLKKNLAKVGEDIGLELGAQMVRSYQEANPTEVKWHLIGREIIEQILAQPGCVAIKFLNAYNEAGQKTLVYVGINEKGKEIVEYSVINTEGQLQKEKGIVADRVNNDDGGFDLWKWLFG